MEGQRFLKSHFSLEGIHQQIASLRRENRFLKFGLVFCLVIATLPYLAGFQPTTIRAKRLVTEKIEFVRGGQTVLSIDVNPITDTLVIWRKGVQPLVFLGYGIWGGTIGVYNKDFNPVATLNADKDGGSVSVLNKNLNPVASMCVIKDEGAIFIADKKGNIIWSVP